MEYGLSQNGFCELGSEKNSSCHYKKTGYHIDRDMLKLVLASGLCIKKIEIKYAGVCLPGIGPLCAGIKMNK
jgi:hypothetical protein